MTLGRKARRFAAGLYRYDGTYLYVNKGVGFGFRFRFGVRPEVAVLDPAAGLSRVSEPLVPESSARTPRPLHFAGGQVIIKMASTGAVRAGGPSPASLRHRRGKPWHSQGKHSNEGSEPTSTGSPLARLAEQSQLDFELDFFGGILERHPDYVDVLRVHGNNLTLKGRYAEGLQIDKRLVQLRPTDPLAHYNLACSYALLKTPRPGPQDAAPGRRAGLPRLPLHARGPRPRLHPPRPALPPTAARVREPLTVRCRVPSDERR